nr:integrase, catalytic region, zinc finger, CCHC-type, peptidase aspartic, catalytic [Tanacetum cinerariifolium]
MILESVENGPLIWPSIEENGVTRPKKYSKLSVTDAIQADCDVKETNIILQGLPPESPQYGSPYQSQQYSNNQSSTPLSTTYPSNDYQSSVHHNVYSPSSSIPILEYAPSVNQQPKFSQPDSGLIVPVFQKGEGHMSKECTKPKRKQDDSWFKDKVLLVQAQASGQILHEEELAFLADLGIPEGVKPSTSASGSQPSGNTKKDKIQRPPRSTQKNKVEAHHRTVKSSLKNKNCAVEPKRTTFVQHSKLNVNSELKCVFQIVLWYLDFGCSKHMTGDRSQLTNFINKFLGTVKFRNDHVAKILGYGDYQIGNVTISRVYYVEGLGHNLFSVGQFCDSNLEVAFRQHTCFIRNLKGVDLLTRSRGNNLYTGRD